MHGWWILGRQARDVDSGHVFSPLLIQIDSFVMTPFTQLSASKVT